jgi:hypothetical protein
MDHRPHNPRRIHHYLPDPRTPSGTVLYSVIAGLIIWAITDVLSHLLP